jgi:hypothetical protein
MIPIFKRVMNKKYSYFVVGIVVVVILLFFFVRQVESYENIDECKYDIGFIVMRHVNTKESNDVWITCVRQIRKYYPDYPIVILDDNSNKEFLVVPDNLLTNNVIVVDVEPEHYKSAEILPYYYNYKYKWFRKMIFIQDSIFINSFYDFTKVEKVKFIAIHPHDEWCQKDSINDILSMLNYNDELKEYYKTMKWNVCWGVMSVMDYSFLKYINEKYNLPILLKYVKNRELRVVCERVWGILCCYEVPALETDPSIFVNLIEQINNLNYSYNAFKSGIMPDSFDQPILKIGLGR